MSQSFSARNIGAAAARDLRAIRLLMERATVYEAISAPTALFAGACSAVAGAVLAGSRLSPALFLVTWFVILAAVNVFNGVALARRARRRGEPFVSEGMKLTLRAVAPPLGVGALLGSWMVLLALPAVGVAIWVICYGLALCATATFSPPAIHRLGVSFAVAGLVLATLVLPLGGHDQLPFAWLAMAACFGLFHLAYAAILTLSRRESPAPIGDAPSPDHG